MPNAELIDVKGLREAQEAQSTTKLPIADPDTIGHQGDVNFTLARAATKKDLAATRQSQMVVAKGQHGQHILVGDIDVTPDGIVVNGEAVLYHTDVPRARHGAVRFKTGVWVFWPHAELQGSEVIVQRD